jgi:NTE family protein
MSQHLLSQSVSVETAFVLGGGGAWGAYEVGMLRALLEAGVEPDLVLGTSVGAINGSAFAADPGLDCVERLEKVWTELDSGGVFEGSLFTRLSTAIRSRTHLFSNDTLRRLLTDELAGARIEELPLPFQCVAASIERAAEHWFTKGPVIEAVLASCAVPGLLPPVEIDGEHYLDGGLVDSVPLGRAVQLGARRIFILHAGLVEKPLAAPKQPWQVASVVFEIARRHRFTRAFTDLPDGAAAYLMPTGNTPDDPDEGIGRYLRYRDYSQAHDRIQRAYQASAAFLASLDDDADAASGAAAAQADAGGLSRP